MKRAKCLLSIGIVVCLFVLAVALSDKGRVRAQEAGKGKVLPRIDLAANAREMETAAKENYEYYLAAYDVETAVILDVYRWSYSWMTAGRTANKGAHGEIAAIERHLKRMQNLHARIKARREVGVNHPPCVSETRYWVLEAERILEEARRTGG